MTDTLIVIVGDQVAGSVTRLSGGRLRFDYTDDYRTRTEATPLSVSMPVEVASHPDHIITPWMLGLLPDNEAVLRRWARQFHASTNPFALLATRIGEDCPGAVRFVAPERLDVVLNDSGQVHRLTHADVAERLRDLRADATAWLGRDFTGQFSLGGAQAKTALLQDDRGWGEPAGAIPTTHILKPAVAGLDDHDLNEHICLDAARRCGLVAVRTRVETFGNDSAVVVERYDRITDAEGIARIHQEDLCQALAVKPENKYQSAGGPSPSVITKLLRRVMPPRAADDAVWRFADALIWNWLIGGTDAHAKNYSLLLAGNQIRLAPLYDVASSLPYDTHEKNLRLAMTIGGDYRVFPWHNTWPGAAKDLALDSERLLARVIELASLVPDAIADAARSDQVAALQRGLPGTLTDLVAGRAERCRRLLNAPTVDSVKVG